MEIPKKYKSFIENRVLERYKTWKRGQPAVANRLELFKSYLEGYQYEDDKFGVGRTRLRDVADRQRSRELRGSDYNLWRFRVNDNIVDEIVNYFLVDYIITDPSFDMVPLNDDISSVQTAKGIDRLIRYGKEISGFEEKNLEASLLRVLTGSVWYYVYENDGQAMIDYLADDKVIDDGECINSEDSDFLIRIHDLRPDVFKDEFKDMYKKLFKNSDPYESKAENSSMAIGYSLDELYKLYDNVKQNQKNPTDFKIRVLEILTQRKEQFFMVETADEAFEFAGLFKSKYPMKYPYLRSRFKASPLASGGSSPIPDLIEVQNAINYITNAALNNIVEISNVKRFIPATLQILGDQDGEVNMIPQKSQTFRYVGAPDMTSEPIFYDKPPTIAPELLQYKDAIIQRTYRRMGITEASRGLLPASRTSSKALETLLQQRNNQSSPYLVLYKSSLQLLAKKYLQMAKSVYNEEKLLKIIGQDSLYAVKQIKEYIPDDPIVTIVAGSDINLSSDAKMTLVLQVLQYGGVEAFADEKLLKLLGLNTDETFRPPYEADRNQAIMQLAGVLAGGETPVPERGQNHLVYLDEVSKLKKTRQWEQASMEVRARINKLEFDHMVAQQSEMYQLQLIDQIAKANAQQTMRQAGMQPAPVATAPGESSPEPAGNPAQQAPVNVTVNQPQPVPMPMQ